MTHIPILAAVLVLLSYLIGSVSGSLLIGRIKDVDIRTMGSGNAGGTNAFRTQGLGFALPVVLIDIGKGALAASLPWWITTTVAPESLSVLTGFAAIVGHCYPIWHGFQGGKGAGTAMGAMAVIQAGVLLPAISIWVLVLTLSGWVGLATIVAFLSLPPLMLWLQAPLDQLLMVCALTLLVLYTHRSNISRMRKGTENRFEKAMLRYWLEKKGSE